MAREAGQAGEGVAREAGGGVARGAGQPVVGRLVRCLAPPAQPAGQLGGHPVRRGREHR